MSILFVAPTGMDENSDRARTVARKCTGVEVRDIDVNRLAEMPASMKGVPTLVDGDEMLMGSDCLAALVDIMAETPPQVQSQQPQQPQQPQLTPQTTAPPQLSEKDTGKMSAQDVQNKLNAYRSTMNISNANF
jgi:hypothetical protein